MSEQATGTKGAKGADDAGDAPAGVGPASIALPPTYSLDLTGYVTEALRPAAAAGRRAPRLGTPASAA